ncbi:hypothetical protein L596_015739 [Steinernema carpocapsae]|uniref:F-box domain-containing protein n=1 Tax=Steinernema carpocapsae TaxID=34508 RepID=A0A4U5NGQ8_STECR|nr:hypothetical protein L596_015739 [Steinernema carpocapsae]
MSASRASRLDEFPKSYRELKKKLKEEEFIRKFNRRPGLNLAEVPFEIIALIQTFLSSKDKKNLRLTSKSLNQKIIPWCSLNVVLTVRISRFRTHDIFYVRAFNQTISSNSKGLPWRVDDFLNMDSRLKIVGIHLHSSTDLNSVMHPTVCRDVEYIRSYTLNIRDYASVNEVSSLEFPVKSLEVIQGISFNRLRNLKRLAIVYCGPPNKANHQLLIDFLSLNMSVPQFQFCYGGFDVASIPGAVAEVMTSQHILQIVDLYYMGQRQGTIRLPRITPIVRDELCTIFKDKSSKTLQHKTVWQLNSQETAFDVRLQFGRYLLVNLDERRKNQSFVTFRVRVAKFT